jgi:hypothetical protein
MTITDLKTDLEKQVNIPIKQQKLYYCGKVIGDEEEILLLKGIDGGCEVFKLVIIIIYLFVYLFI